MKIQIIDGSTRFSGGRRMLFLHANELVRRGHDVTLWVEKDPQFDWLRVDFPVRLLTDPSLCQLPTADICLFQRWRFAGPLETARRGLPVHFCQGFEGTDAENRLAQALAQPWRHLANIWKLWRRLRRLEQAYHRPSAKIVVHRPLRKLLAERFGQFAYLVPYGLDENVFHAEGRRLEGAPRVLVVGPFSIGWKRIADAVEAVRLVKRRRPDVRLVRVAPEPMSDAERSLGVTDEYHTMLAPAAMAEQYRRADVLVVSSDATEGFGLPALEAMACGTPTVLTAIPSFRSFAEPIDYAQFVSVGRPERIADALDEVLSDPPLQVALRQRGLAVAARYTMVRSFQAMTDALTDIAQRGVRRFQSLPA